MVFECVQCVKFFIPFDMCLYVSVCFSTVVSYSGWMNEKEEKRDT